MNGPWTSTSHPYITPQRADVWAADAAARGRVGTQRLLAVELVQVDEHVQSALNLNDNERAVVRRRLILEDDLPVELADSYYPEWLASGTALAEHRKIRGGAVSVLAELDHAPSEVIEHVTAGRPDEKVRAVLDIGENEPLLVLARLSRDAGGVPVEYAVMRTVALRSPGLTYRMRVSA